ncbi:hypothetical protein PVAP13_7NG133734 [Panicum virgatum]|uniref:Uncharacterized protein n=1 Tax=Panicum virgatum TaxID=38727 RepID=A0A8T0PUL8_PANVG|nr:hypothetical protein PVAP13_7NG133734 [Panicum virgatum]
MRPERSGVPRLGRSQSAAAVPPSPTRQLLSTSPTTIAPSRHRQETPAARRPSIPSPPASPAVALAAPSYPPRPLPRALRPAAPVPARNDADAAVLFHLQIELQERAREAAEKWKSRVVPWAAARDEGLKVALQREKKTREPRAETELAAGELDRLPKPPRPPFRRRRSPWPLASHHVHGSMGCGSAHMVIDWFNAQETGKSGSVPCYISLSLNL